MKRRGAFKVVETFTGNLSHTCCSVRTGLMMKRYAVAFLMTIGLSLELRVGATAGRTAVERARAINAVDFLYRWAFHRRPASFCVACAASFVMKDIRKCSPQSSEKTAMVDLLPARRLVRERGGGAGDFSFYCIGRVPAVLFGARWLGERPLLCLARFAYRVVFALRERAGAAAPYCLAGAGSVCARDLLGLGGARRARVVGKSTIVSAARG